MSGGESILLYGKNGFVGGWIIAECKKRGITLHLGEARLQNREHVETEVDKFKPTFVINAAGVTGRPNVDWCEDHKQETIRANVLGALNLVDICFLRDIHVTNWSTGCIYTYDESHPVGKAMTEEDAPNFAGSFYAHSKGLLEQMLKTYPNVLNLRLRMPISDDLHERSLVTKLIKYEKIVGDVPNSMSVMYDLVPISIDATLRRLKGIYNFTNPGAVTHNQILSLYKKHIDPDFTWSNFTIAEQDKVIKAPRSNTELSAAKLLKEFPDLPPIDVALESCFQRMKVNLGK